MTIEKSLNWANQYLANKKIQTAFLDAQVLLCHTLKITKEYLVANPKTKIAPTKLLFYFYNIYRRGKGLPVAYIKKHKEFYGLDFYVNKNVLIPRPETELLVEETLSQLLTVKSQLLNVIDIGTGSGCVAIALAKNLPEAKIIATDISEKALAVAKNNARFHQVKIDFYQSNLLDSIKEDIDIVVANLPYGWNEWKNNSSAETIGLKFEPKEALFTKENGLYLYRLLFEQTKAREYKPQLILCEFDPRQTDQLTLLAKNTLPEYQLEIKKDLAGLDRVLSLKTNQ
jgi:release factor glutamine methyltransferase